VLTNRIKRYVPGQSGARWTLRDGVPSHAGVGQFNAWFRTSLL
jgi:hypothetical protein